MISPLEVVARRSSDVFAVTDPLVAHAVTWIRANAERPLNVPMVARAVGSSRQRLKRHFRALLARTVQQEIRRVRVELAKRMLVTTSADLTEIAARSGFSSAALLSVAFQRELGMPRRLSAPKPRACLRYGSRLTAHGTESGRGAEISGAASRGLVLNSSISKIKVAPPVIRGGIPSSP